MEFIFRIETKREARFFKIRNADAEKMSSEEIFKSMVAYKDPTAMAHLDLLQKCNLDVEGLNPVNSKVLGGLKCFQEIFAKHLIACLI